MKRRYSEWLEEEPESQLKKVQVEYDTFPTNIDKIDNIFVMCHQTLPFGCKAVVAVSESEAS